MLRLEIISIIVIPDDRHTILLWYLFPHITVPYVRCQLDCEFWSLIQ